MSVPDVYCIDTSSLLEAWNRSYPPAIFPSLWEKLEALIAEARLRSPEEVLEELERKEDNAYKWAKAQNKLFVPLDSRQVKEVQRVLAGATRIVDTAKGRHRADSFVIALAKLHGYIVVTEETSSTRHPKIPDICDHHNVDHITVLELIRREQWTF